MVNIFISILISKVYFTNFQYMKIDEYETLESETHEEEKKNILIMRQEIIFK